MRWVESIRPLNKREEKGGKGGEGCRVLGKRGFIDGGVHREAGGERLREVGGYGKEATITMGSSQEGHGGTVHGTGGGGAWRGPCAERVVPGVLFRDISPQRDGTHRFTVYFHSIRFPCSYLALLPNSDPDPGSHSGSFSLPPTTVAALILIARIN